MSNTINLKDEEDEALSLSDFPLNSDEPDYCRRPSSQPPDIFEFSNDRNSVDRMSHAEDIISCGKLMPYKHDLLLKSASDGHHDLNPTRLTRSSRSFDSKNLRRRNSNVKSDIHRSFSKNIDSISFRGGSKPRWYGLMFGVAKFPPEMDLRDIRSRQVRRGMSPAGKRSPGRSSWGHDLLMVLSCKDHQSVAVTV